MRGKSFCFLIRGCFVFFVSFCLYCLYCIGYQCTILHDRQSVLFDVLFTCTFHCYHFSFLPQTSEARQSFGPKTFSSQESDGWIGLFRCRVVLNLPTKQDRLEKETPRTRTLLRSKGHRYIPLLGARTLLGAGLTILVAIKLIYIHITPCFFVATASHCVSNAFLVGQARSVSRVFDPRQIFLSLFD